MQLIIEANDMNQYFVPYGTLWESSLFSINMMSLTGQFHACIAIGIIHCVLILSPVRDHIFIEDNKRKVQVPYGTKYLCSI